jgi:uncharacterized SAM-dependent methyltransferase
MVNDLIFKELLKRKYTLVGNTRVWDIADSKLWYLTQNQAKGFFDVEKNKNYFKSTTQKEISLIKSNLPEFTKKLKEKAYNLIDLGCGDGRKAAMFINDFSKTIDVRYCPIDISSYMVNSASETMRKMKFKDVLEFNWNISDFENLENVIPLFRGIKHKHNFLILLGNTIGNFEGNEILHTIRKTMTKGDYLLIGNGIIKNNSKELLKGYYNKEMIDFWIQPLILLGFNKNDVEYRVRFEHSRMEMYFNILRDKNITNLGKTIEFKKEDIILVGISYKYKKEEIENKLKQEFKHVKMYIDSTETYAIALCKI